MHSGDRAPWGRTITFPQWAYPRSLSSKNSPRNSRRSRARSDVRPTGPIPRSIASTSSRSPMRPTSISRSSDERRRSIMSLLASREVRWFGARDERSEAALKNWIEHQDPYDPDERFLAEGIWDPPDTREDKYAIVPASVDMGIKWREDQLQVKG